MFFATIEIPKDVGIQKNLTSLHINTWLKDDVFHFRWWLLLFLISFALIIWYKFLDKSRFPEIFLYVVLATIMALGIFEYGNELILWDYPTDILPIFPPLTSLNLLSLPLIYSLIYQKFNTNRSFIWATLLITLIVCFIIEPLLSLVGLIQLLNWKYYYSFPIYSALAIFTRTLVIKINKINVKHNSNNLNSI